MVPLSVLRSLRMQHWSGKCPAIFAPRHWVIIKHDHVLSDSITFLHSQHQHLTLIWRPPSSLFQDFQAHSEVLDTKAHCFARQLLNTIETMTSIRIDSIDPRNLPCACLTCLTCLIANLNLNTFTFISWLSMHFCCLNTWKCGKWHLKYPSYHHLQGF